MYNMAGPWDKLGQAGSVLQEMVGMGITTHNLISMIVKAAKTTVRNQDACLQLAQNVVIVGKLLEHLDTRELTGHQETRAPLEQLDLALRHAFDLIKLCHQPENMLIKLFKSDNVAHDLRMAQEKIDRYVNLFPVVKEVAASIRAREDATNDPELFLRDATDLQALEQLPPTFSGSDQSQEVITPTPYLLSVLGYPTANLSDLYEIGSEQEQFGSTYHLCTELATGIGYACKSIYKSKFTTREDIEAVRTEIQIMHLLFGHENVVAIKSAYEDQLYVHIVMELCSGGNLMDCVIQRGKCSERKAAELTSIIVGVIEHCHSLGIFHGDIRPENFLLCNRDGGLSLKAINFGSSVFFEPGQAFTNEVIVGRPYYVAPEVLSKNYGPSADVWAAGVILYMLLSGVPPFYAETEEGIFDAVLKGDIDFDSDPWPEISHSAKNLIRRMLNPLHAGRLTAHEVLCHPWFQHHDVASDHPREAESVVFSLMKQFSAMKKLKKLALHVIATESLLDEEIEGFKHIFQTMDTDSSGTITYDELEKGLRRYGSTLKPTEIRDLMDGVDIDNSGTIDYVKFIAAMLHLNKLQREEHLVSAFSYFDENDSGYITVEALQQVCKYRNLLEDFLKGVTEEAVDNYGGRISYKEFVAMMTRSSMGEQSETV